jgi:hypothetical protein
LQVALAGTSKLLVELDATDSGVWCRDRNESNSLGSFQVAMNATAVPNIDTGIRDADRSRTADELSHRTATRR